MNKRKINIKKILYICIIVVFLLILILICKKVFRNNKIGDNMNSQEIVDYILNINSYKARIYVETISNKNNNKYIIDQEYNTENGDVAIVLEPKNIEGVKIIKQDNTLKIENNSLNLNKIYENYNELQDNNLDLSSFIKDYKSSLNSSYKEDNDEIVMSTNTENGNKYTKNKILYIDKKTILPKKLIITDNNQKTTINIEYNEIELN